VADSVSITVDVGGFDAVRQRLIAMASPAQRKRWLLVGGRHLKSKINRYPPVRRLTRRQVYGQPFQSAKQRRWFFAALRRGDIVVPYYRGQNPKSENLGQSWTVAMRDEDTAVVGTQVSYARYAMGRGKQSRYHQAVGWKTAEDQADAAAPEVVSVVQGEIARTISETAR